MANRRCSLCSRLEHREVAPEALQEVERRGDATKAVLAHGLPQELPDTDSFVSLRGGRRQAVWNRLEETLAPPRLNPAEPLGPEHQIANRSNGVRGVDVVDNL